MYDGETYEDRIKRYDRERAMILALMTIFVVVFACCSTAYLILTMFLSVVQGM